MGPLAVARDGRPVALPPSKKTRALLAYLVASGRPHRREQLCSIFWDVPDDPRGALRWSLSKIRGLVDGDDAPRLVADRETVRFEPHGAAVDALALRERLPEIERLPTDALAELARRAEGEFLAGLDLPNCEGFQAWCIAQREDLRAATAKVLKTLVARLGADPGAALPHARRLVELDPFDGDARVLLMKLLASAGRRREAEQQFTLGSEALAQAGLAAHVLQRARREMDTAPAAPAAAAPPAQKLEQTIRFCTAADGVRLAYATVGSGKPIVKTANWMNHLEFDWQSPGWRHVLDYLAAEHTLIRYDQRGNGLSDWDAADISFDAFLGDLETVVGATGLQRFTLLGVSQGCAVAIAYAVRHPERVEKLVLYGGYAKGWRHRGPEEVARREALGTLMRLGWGKDNPAFRQVFSTLFMPNAGPEQMAWFNELQRVSTSPENAFRLAEVFGAIDVRPLLAKVAVPTLVVHCREDSVAPFAEGRELAAGISGASFVALESANHLVLDHEPAWPILVAKLREFLA